jgi:hypothetical protein
MSDKNLNDKSELDERGQTGGGLGDEVHADPAPQETLKEKIDKVLMTLTYREREIIKLRYGLGECYTNTWPAVARIFKTTRQHVQQIEAKAVRKLRHPVRLGKHEGVLDSLAPEDLMTPEGLLLQKVFGASLGNSFLRIESIDAGQNHDELLEGGGEQPPWSEWVMVADWLHGGAEAPLKPPDRSGVYRFRVCQAHPTHPGKVLYIGISKKSTGKGRKGVDNLTGLRRRMWQFISSALGFGMETNPGCKIGQYKVSARELEASWAVVDCPNCVEHEEYHRAKPLLNKNEPPRCNRGDCPRKRR